MNQDGTINVQSGATEIGQGADNRLLANGGRNRGGSGQRRSRYFNSRYRRYAVRSWRICLTPELCCRARAAQCGTIIKEKIIAHAAVMLHQSAMNLTLIKGHIVLAWNDRKSR